MTNRHLLATQIAVRLATSLLSAWLLLAVLTAAGLMVYFNEIRQEGRLEQSAEAIQDGALRLNAAITDEVLYLRAYLITGDEAALTSRQLANETAGLLFERLAEDLAKAPLADPALLASLVEKHAQYFHFAGQMIALKSTGQPDEAVALFDAQSRPLAQAMQDDGQALQTQIQRSLQARTQAASHQNRLVVFAAAGVMLIIVAVSGLIVVFNLLPLLQALHGFEAAVLRSAETGSYQPLPQEAGRPPLPLTLAFNRVVGDLVSSTSAMIRYLRHTAHEANSLLTPVLGYGAMIAQPELSSPDADVRAYGQVIVEQAQRVTSLLESAALAARIEARQYAPDLAPMRLAPLLEALTAEVAEESGREITLEGCPPDLMVRAGALDLQRAVRVLLENAVKYSPAPAPVAVVIAPGGERERMGRRVLIQVIDQGAGLSPVEMRQLFQPFSRLKNAATQAVPGNGLGLYLAQAIVRAHQGSLSVQSGPGRGATFTITLPAEGA